jgi:hypothetical protein
MLEAENKAYERVIKAMPPAIIYIRTEQIIKPELSPLLRDPMFRQFFGNAVLQMPRKLRQHSLGTDTAWAIGILVGIGMLFSGISRLMLSLAARRLLSKVA